MDRLRLLWILMLIAVLSLPGGSAYLGKDQHSLSKHIITVDNEPGDADYTSIADALNHSSPGDTIEVFSGTYNENHISITVEGISLIGIPHELGNGSDTGEPFINGQGLNSVFIVHSRNVTITGFHIENKGGYIGDWYIVLIQPGADNCTISNSNFRSSSNSIVYCGSNYSTIINNTISDAGLYCGIGFGYPAHHNVASGNVIDKCPRGIYFWGSEFDTIIRNRISNCSEFGIVIGGGGANTFRYNTFENNSIGLSLYQTQFNVIKDNNFLHNSYSASFGEALWVITNRWIHNYWDRPRLLPYPIQGSNFIFPWVQFDWRPALKPYNITAS
jgi:nitrous oxidase accessory protein